MLNNFYVVKQSSDFGSGSVPELSRICKIWIWSKSKILVLQQP